MHRAFVLVCCSVAFAACGSSSDPVELCTNAVAALCNRAFVCEPAASQGVWGTVESCTTTLSAATPCTPAGMTCPAGSTFSTDNAKQCESDYTNQPCTDVANGVVPTSCISFCT